MQKKVAIRQTHSGSGDNVYGDKIIYAGKKTISRQLTIVPDADAKVFFGNIEVIEKIKLTLSLHNRVLLHAIRGRGKTNLATQFVNKHTQDFQHIAWLSCKTSIAQAFLESTELMNKIGIAFNNDMNEHTRFRLLQDKLTTQIKGTTLIVIDNVEKKHEQELHQLSLSDNFKILLTSHERIADFELIELPALNFEAAQALFCKVAGREKNNLNRNHLADIFRLSGYHPIAIEALAKKFSTSYGQSLEAFVSDLKQKNIGNSLKELMINIMDVTSLNDQEQVVMRCFSILPSTYIPHQAIQQVLGVEAERLQEIAASLIEKGFLNEDSTLGFRCQQIIQDAARTQLKPDENNCAEMLNAMGSGLFGTVSTLGYRQLHATASTLLPLLQSAADHISSEVAPFNHVFKNMALFAKVLGDFEQAKAWITKSLRINEAISTELDTEALQVYADVCLCKGDYQEAETILSKHIQYLQAEGRETYEMGLTYERLGMLYLKSGCLPEAVENLRMAVELYDKLGTDNMTAAHIAQTNTNIGLALVKIGLPNEAQEVLNEAVQYYEAVKDDLALGYVFHYLSIAHIVLTEFHKAGLFLKRAKQYLAAELPVDELIFAELINNSTVITVNSFMKEEATFDRRDIEDMLQEQTEAIRILQSHRPPEHADFALYYFNLARLYQLSGDGTSARQWASKSIEVLRQNSQEDKNLNLANFYFTIATQMSDMLSNTEIENYITQAIDTLPRKEEYKALLATFFLTLGGIYAGSENHVQATNNFEKSYDAYRQVFLEDHPVHAFVLYCLATCKRMMGQYNEALRYQQQVMEVCQHLMPENDPDMAFPYSGMAQIYVDMGYYKEAITFRQKAVRVNDGSMDLSELDQIGQLRLIKITRGQDYYAYVIEVSSAGRKEPVIDDDLIIAQYYSLEDAMSAYEGIKKDFGNIDIVL